MNATQPQSWEAPQPASFRYDRTGRQPRGQGNQGFGAVVILGLMLTALMAFCLAAVRAARRQRLADSLEENEKDATRQRIRDALKIQGVTMVCQLVDE